MANVQQLIEGCRSRLRRTRNLLTVLDSEEFAQAARIFTVEELVHIEEVVASLEVDKLRAMVRDTLLKLTPLERMGIKQLREIASTLCVKNYYNLAKTDLVEEIKHASQHLEVQRSAKCSPSVCDQPTKTSLPLGGGEDYTSDK